MAGAIERAVRRRVPSGVLLSYNPAVKVILRAADLLPRLWFREFRQLPPSHLRMRVGVRNRIFASQVAYMTKGTPFWLWAFSEGFCALSSDIVEIGCGCGRRTHLLHDLGSLYTGRYLGIDIDPEMLAWCRQRFERFEFHQTTQASQTYGEQSDRGRYRIPAEDRSVDFFFGTSVLTHLLEDDLRNYLEEGARVLRPGRSLVMSCYCIDRPPSDFGSRHTFAHRIGEAHVESLRYPEAAVAYSEQFLIEAAEKAGFTAASIRSHPKMRQMLLVAMR